MAMSRPRLSENSRIQSFIIYDCETTGLDNPRKTELCLIAVLRDDLLTGEDENPRVMNKLLLCMDPVKNISERATELSGNVLAIF